MLLRSGWGWNEGMGHQSHVNISHDAVGCNTNSFDGCIQLPHGEDCSTSPTGTRDVNVHGFNNRGGDSCWIDRIFDVCVFERGRK